MLPFLVYIRIWYVFIYVTSWLNVIFSLYFSCRLKKHNILCEILNLDCIAWQLATTLVKLLSYPFG